MVIGVGLGLGFRLGVGGLVGVSLWFVGEPTLERGTSVGLSCKWRQ